MSTKQSRMINNAPTFKLMRLCLAISRILREDTLIILNINIPIIIPMFILFFYVELDQCKACQN